MKAATIFAVALATLSSFPSTAQQQPAQQQQQQPMQQPPQPMEQTQQPSAQQQQQQPTQQPPMQQNSAQPPSMQQQNAPDMQARASQLKPVTGELVSKLDSKSAKQGDSVVVKTSEDVRFPGGAEIPKGSKLVGHVTNVQARGEGKENSQIAIQFDRAEIKGGQDMAIESVIQSLSPATDAGSGASMNNGNNGVPGNYGTPAATGTSSGATAPGMNGSAPSMNGSNNGVNGTSSGMNGSSSGMNRPNMGSNTTAQPGTTDQNTNSGPPAPGSIVARNGNVAIRMTAIPGVLLANNINGLPFTNASGMLLGARRDIHLDGGTQMVVAIAAAPQAAGGGMSR